MPRAEPRLERTSQANGRRVRSSGPYASLSAAQQVYKAPVRRVGHIAHTAIATHLLPSTPSFYFPLPSPSSLVCVLVLCGPNIFFVVPLSFLDLYLGTTSSKDITSTTTCPSSRWPRTVVRTLRDARLARYTARPTPPIAATRVSLVLSNVLGDTEILW